MKKNLFKRVLSVAASAALVLIAVPAFPTEVKAASGASFIQEIKVNDLSDHLHEAGIKVPALHFEYFFDPVVDDDLLPSSGRYQTNMQNFPTGTSSPDGNYRKQTVNLNIAAGTSASDGIIRSAVDLDVASGDPFAALTWEEANKVYRYKLTISNISIGSSAGVDVRTAGDGLFSGGDDVIYCDVDINQNNAIRTIVFHKDPSSTVADDKVEGFTDSAELALSYNVYDIVVTSDYIGDSNNYDTSQVNYKLSITNLPSYLSQQDIMNNICSGTSSSEYVGENRQNWAQNASSDANTAYFNGPLQNGWHQTFPGIPVVGNGGPVEFNTEMNYNNLTNNNDFNSTIYVGGNAAPLTSDITTLELFRAWDAFSDYGNMDNTSVILNDNKHTATLATNAIVQQSTSADANNVRFVIFDPNSLILVGVVVNALPAIILVAIAGVGGVLLFRRRKAD